MTDANRSMNDWIRRGRNRNRWTVTPDGIEVHDAEADQEVPEEPTPAPFPDLGQGARGTIRVRGIDMSERLRRQRDWARSGWGDIHPGDDAA